MNALITADEVRTRWEQGSRYVSGVSGMEFYEEYEEPTSRFGLDKVPDGFVHDGLERWYAAQAPLPDPVDVPLDLVQHTTQDTALVSVIAHVLEHGTDEAPCDPEGWFDNDRPLLLGLADGTYVVRDGNHRTIGGKLRCDAALRAYVIPHDWSE